MTWVAERLLLRLDKAAGQAASPTAALQAVFMAHIGFVSERPGVPRLIFGELQRPGQTVAKQMVQTLIQQYGERLRIVLVNDTMMTHPMHLHGMWSEVETPDGQFLVRRHTIPVQPAQRVSFLVTADALGRWAWHCHLMLHMDMGMFRVVVVS